VHDIPLKVEAMAISHRWLLLHRAALALAALSVAVPLAADERRGTMAFHYGGPLSQAELEWYGRFDAVVTHDPLPRAQVDALHARGAHLVLYEWAVAFYASLVPTGSWQERLLRERHALLNGRGLRGGSGAADADAFYYDPAAHEHRIDRARAIAERLHTAGYDGVFLDTTTFANVHPDAAAEYRQRHPDVPYDAAFAQFLKTLRKELHGGVIVTNQGYRDAAHYLPYADYDVTESLITRDGRLRPWRDPRDQWNSIDFVMRTMIAPAMKRYPRVRFVHLNYLPKAEPDDVLPVAAIARLFGGEAFVALSSIVAPPSADIYFLDCGTPRTPIRYAEKHEAAYRWFAHVLVAVNASAHPLVIANPDGGEAIVVPAAENGSMGTLITARPITRNHGHP